LLLSFDLAESGEDVVLDLGEFLVGNLTELEPHLGLEQPLAQRRVVLGLGFGRGDDLVEDESQAANQKGVEDEHPRQAGRAGRAGQAGREYTLAPLLPDSLTPSPISTEY